MQPSGIKPGQPYCSNCGYLLLGLENSSKCPECGKSLIEVLQRGDQKFYRGKRYTSEAKLFGLPLVSIAFGPSGEEMSGKAKGIIALGDSALGFMALGGRSCGIVSAGGLSVGVASLGGMSLGLVTSLGGCSISGGFAVGGLAIAGGVAMGGGAIAGYAAVGGGALAYYAAGGSVHGKHVIKNGTASSQQAQDAFDGLKWLLGSSVPNPVVYQPLAVSGSVFVTLSLLIGCLALYGFRRHEREVNEPFK